MTLKDTVTDLFRRAEEAAKSAKDQTAPAAWKDATNDLHAIYHKLREALDLPEPPAKGDKAPAAPVPCPSCGALVTPGKNAEAPPAPPAKHRRRILAREQAPGFPFYTREETGEEIEEEDKPPGK